MLEALNESDDFGDSHDDQELLFDFDDDLYLACLGHMLQLVLKDGVPKDPLIDGAIEKTTKIVNAGNFLKILFKSYLENMPY